jgi:outer membrane protein assembly factor BamA
LKSVGPLLILLVVSSSALSAEAPQPVVVEEKSPLWPRILGAPFAVPPAIVRGVGYPLRAFGDWSEKINLPLRTMDFFSNDERTMFWYPTYRTGGKGGGLFGLGATHRDLWESGYSASIRAAASPALDMDAAAGIRSPSVGDPELHWSSSVSFRRRQEEKFYGIGNDSLKSDKSGFDWRLTTVKVPGVDLSLTKWLKWDLSTSFVFSQQQDLASDPLSLDFPVPDLVGLDVNAYGVEAGTGVTIDSRSSMGAPESGTVFKASLSRFQGNSEFEFFRSRVSLAQYLSVFGGGRILALGAYWEWAGTPGGGEIPFSLLPSLGGNRALRAYDTYRFRDRTSLLFVGEYRYPIWRFTDGVLFLEGGRVAPRVSHLNPDDFHLSYGGGLRFRSSEAFFFSLIGAQGADGFRFAFAFNQPL